MPADGPVIWSVQNTDIENFHKGKFSFSGGWITLYAADKIAISQVQRKPAVAALPLPLLKETARVIMRK
jgi:hypothetical protein